MIMQPHFTFSLNCKLKVSTTMDSFKHNLNNLSFFESLAPFYCTLKIIGLAPYNFNFKTGIIKSTFLNYIIVFLNLAIHFIAILISGVDSFNSKSTTNKLAHDIWNYQLFFTSLTALFFVVHNYIKRQHVFNYIKLLNHVDKVFNNSEWKYQMNHLKNCFKIVFWLFIHIVMLVLFYFLILFANSLISIYLVLINIISFFSVHICIMVVYEFMFSVCCINSQFDCLNKNAEFYLNSLKMEFALSQNQVNTKLECIKKLAILHDLLNDAIDCINNIYSIEVIMSYVSFIIVII